MDRYEIRAATSEHIDGLHQLARHLNSVNLPNNREAIARLLDASERSFSGAIADPLAREYVFVLVDLALNRIAGTSMIIAQLGRRGAPYIYFDVQQVEKYSDSLDRHFVHTLLATTYCYEGPTEIGGLVVEPTYRRAPEKLGMLISYVRFLFIAMHRELFRNELLAELLPPFEPDGTSVLWEAIGRRFTGLTYQEADHLSRRNKEFIRSLFPDVVHATLLSPAAQQVIGQVGESTLGVEKMLRRVGFEYAHRVDPFDGGPHFTAQVGDVSLIQASRRLSAPGEDFAPSAEPALVGQSFPGPPYFIARLEPGGTAANSGLSLVGTANFSAPGHLSAAWRLPLA